jgi:hypothetical protein
MLETTYTLKLDQLFKPKIIMLLCINLTCWSNVQINNIGSIKIGPCGWKMTNLKKLTIINIKFMKNKKCDGCCEVSSVKFVVGYIDHNLINNVIFYT